jgi:prophage regulatory protein
MTDTFLRCTAVVAVTGIPRSTLYELIKRGLFPRPIKLSERMAAWSSNEISDWQQRRIAARDQKKVRARSRKESRLTTNAPR